MCIKKVEQIPFYKLHNDYLPFVGTDYDKYKILIIGESHYINQKEDAERSKYEIDYFNNNWFDNSCAELKEDFPGWFNTKDVIENYMKGNRTRGHKIFTDLVKSFSKVVLKEEVAEITQESSLIMNCFSFMNFFQMPSLYNGKKFWDSLKISANKIGRAELAYECWNRAVSVSVSTVDSVIDCLKPSLVVFVSKSAYNAYANCESSRYKNAVKHCNHPAWPGWSNEAEGKKKFEQILADNNW